MLMELHYVTGNMLTKGLYVNIIHSTTEIPLSESLFSH